MNINPPSQSPLPAEPLKSILITDWSKQHVAGFDLDGGGAVSYDLDTTVVGHETVGYDSAEWGAGDIATLRVEAGSPLARLRIVTPKSSIVRLREFEITDIDHGATSDKDGKHIFLKGSASNGAIFVFPMLGYTVWKSAWDFTALENALKAANPTGTISGLTYSIDTRILTGEAMQKSATMFNDIFYAGSKNAGTVFDRADRLCIRTLRVNQTDPGTCAQMYVAAFVKKSPSAASAQEKRGTAFSPPYFIIDGKTVFIRTGP